MADDQFHFVLSPGRIRNYSEVLTLSVDAPRNSDADKQVVVTLSEVDTWPLTDGKTAHEQAGVLQVFGTLSGVIKDGHFTVKSVQNTNTANAALPVIKIKVDGDASNTIYSFTVLENVGENEGGFLEIAMKVDGFINGKACTYSPPDLIYVRDIPHHRPVIVFITNVDAPNSSNQFYSTAHSYFGQFTDNGIGEQYEIVDYQRAMTLEEIFDKLHDGKTIWGEINIVAHANEATWVLKSDVANKDRLSVEDIDSLSGGAHPPMLFSRSTQLLPLDATLVDGKTLIVLRGCEIGNNQSFLDALVILFAGTDKVQVLAPKFIQNYGPRSGMPGLAPDPALPASAAGVEFFEDAWDVYFKGTRANDSTLLPACKAIIQKRLSDNNETRNLDKLKIHSCAPDPLGLDATHPGIPFPDGGPAAANPTNDQLAEWAGNNVDPPVKPEDNWKLSVSQVKKDAKGHVTSFTLNGMRTKVDLRQPLLRERIKGDGNWFPPTPLLDNPLDYGQSPLLIKTTGP